MYQLTTQVKKFEAIAIEAKRLLKELMTDNLQTLNSLTNIINHLQNLHLEHTYDHSYHEFRQLTATLSLKHSHLSTTLRSKALIDCEALSANFIDINFVKSLNIDSLDRLSERVLNADESLISSAENNRYYNVTFSVNEEESTTHMFRAISLTNQRIILNMS